MFSVFNFQRQTFTPPGPPLRATSPAQTVETGKVSWARRLPSSACRGWVFSHAPYKKPPIYGESISGNTSCI